MKLPLGGPVAAISGSPRQVLNPASVLSEHVKHVKAGAAALVVIIVAAADPPAVLILHTFGRSGQQELCQAAALTGAKCTCRPTSMAPPIPTNSCLAPAQCTLTNANPAPTHLLLPAAAPSAKPALVFRSVSAQVPLQRLLPTACCARCARCAAAAKVAGRRPRRRRALCPSCFRPLCSGRRTLGCLPGWHRDWVRDDWHWHKGREEAAAVAVPAEEVCGKEGSRVQAQQQLVSLV